MKQTEGRLPSGLIVKQRRVGDELKAIFIHDNDMVFLAEKNAADWSVHHWAEFDRSKGMWIGYECSWEDMRGEAIRSVDSGDAETLMAIINRGRQ